MCMSPKRLHSLHSNQHCEYVVFSIFVNFWYCQILKFLKMFTCQMVFYYGCIFPWMFIFSYFLAVSSSSSVNASITWESDHFSLYLHCFHLGLSTFIYSNNSWLSLLDLPMPLQSAFHTTARGILFLPFY